VYRKQICKNVLLLACQQLVISQIVTIIFFHLLTHFKQLIPLLIVKFAQPCFSGEGDSALRHGISEASSHTRCTEASSIIVHASQRPQVV